MSDRIEQILSDLPGMIAGAVASAVSAMRPEPPAALDQSPEIGELVKALAAARPEFGEVSKEESAGKPGGKTWRYASLDAAITASAEALAKHGLVVIQAPVSEDADRGTITIETSLYHESGQFLRRRLRMPCGNDPQGVGSAITYGRRYAYLPMLNLAPSDDDDGQRAAQSAQRHEQRRAAERRPQPRPAAAPPPQSAGPAAAPAEPAHPAAEAPPVTWETAWDAVRAEFKRVGDVEGVGYEYATKTMLPGLSESSGWPIMAIERVISTELDVLAEDVPRIDSKRRPFAQTWLSRLLKHFPDHVAQIAEYDRAIAEAADDGLDATGGELPGGDGAEDYDGAEVGADGLPVPTVAEILEPLAELPGDSAGAEWALIAVAMAELQEHHAPACKPVFGDHKIAIYKAAQEAHGLGTGDAETYVAECLGVEAFAEVPDVLSAAVVEVLRAFPTKGGGAAPVAQAKPAAAQPGASIPAGWRTFGVGQLATVARALIAQGQIAEEDVPQGSGRAVKDQLIKAIERAVAEHGIGEEG